MKHVATIRKHKFKFYDWNIRVAVFHTATHCSSMYYAGLIIMMYIKFSHDKKVKGGTQVKRK